MPVLSIRVDKKDIGYIRWCLESHDGIANPTTRENSSDTIDLTVAPDFLEDAEDLVEALTRELSVRRVTPPKKSPLFNG